MLRSARDGDHGGHCMRTLILQGLPQQLASLRRRHVPALPHGCHLGSRRDGSERAERAGTAACNLGALAAGGGACLARRRPRATQRARQPRGRLHELHPFGPALCIAAGDHARTGARAGELQPARAWRLSPELKRRRVIPDLAIAVPARVQARGRAVAAGPGRPRSRFESRCPVTA